VSQDTLRSGPAKSFGGHKRRPKMKFDLEKEGLETVLQPWQAELMRFAWNTEEEIGSREAHRHLRKAGTPMSRASVISFLNRMTQEGFLEYREVTDKGGRKRLYRPSEKAQDEGSFRRTIAERIIRKVLEEMAANPRRGG